MLHLHAVIFSLDESNLTRIRLFKENLMKYKGKITSQDVVFIVFSSLRFTHRRFLTFISEFIAKKFLFWEETEFEFRITITVYSFFYRKFDR